MTAVDLATTIHTMVQIYNVATKNKHNTSIRSQTCRKIEYSQENEIVTHLTTCLKGRIC